MNFVECYKKTGTFLQEKIDSEHDLAKDSVGREACLEHIARAYAYMEVLKYLSDLAQEFLDEMKRPPSTSKNPEPDLEL